MQIHQSAEDYLETILMLTQRMGRVRSIDVVNELGYTKASVSIAMKKLRENGYIAVDGEGNLTLLEPGREIAASRDLSDHPTSNKKADDRLHKTWWRSSV